MSVAADVRSPIKVRRIRPAVALRPEILNCLANEKPWRTKALRRKLRSVASGQTIDKELRRLEAAGLIRRLRRGIIISADARIPDSRLFPQSKRVGMGSTKQKIFAFFAKPMPAPALRGILQVSRQRLYLVLKEMIEDGLICRIEANHSRLRFLYRRMKKANKFIIPKLGPSLERQILKCANKIRCSGD